jgi:hypothetical protein
MHTPAAALGWEIWRKHRTRVLAIVGLVLGFALVYPKLCALAGLDPGSPYACWDDLARKFAPPGPTELTPLQVVQVLYVMFLAGGPALAMILTLLYVVWMFTFSEFDPKTEDLMRFPARLFTLPISTPFLFWSIWLGGMAAIAALYGCWVYLVPQPDLEVFEVYQNCFGWMTLLALAQGIVWALAAWPNARLVLLTAMLFGFLFAPALRDIDSVFVSPFLLPSLFVLGSVLARVGLQKMRHGQWRGWTWQRPFAVMPARAPLRGPKRFASPAQAQLWFEWRRSARGLCFITVLLTVVPVVVHLLVRAAAGLRPLSQDTMLGFAGWLVVIPLLLHFFYAVMPARTDVPFLMMRPLTNGQMTVAMLKAAAISTIFSWMIVLAVLYAMPLLGDFHGAAQALQIPHRYWAIIVLGLILLTWRLIVVNLCFVWSGNQRLAAMPVLLLVASYFGAFALFILSQNDAYWNSFWRLVPVLLACLIALKFLLAFLAFRVSLKRGLLAPSAVTRYLAVWTLLAAVLLIPAAILFHGTAWMLPSSLGIVLLTPLARISFCPITLAWNRHQ